MTTTPDPRLEPSPLGLMTPSGKLDGALVQPVERPPLAVVLCHGLPSGAPRDPDDPGYPGLARDLGRMGLAAASFSFRGCYGSDGDFSIRGWLEDLRAVIDAVAERTGAPLAVVGSSLGGAVGLVGAADDDRVRLAATLASPSSLTELAGPDVREAFLDRLREIGLIRSPGFPTDAEAWADEFRDVDPSDAVRRFGRPLLLVHGDADDTVPVEHASRLAEAASGSVAKVVLPGVGHRLRREDVVVRLVFAWLAAQAGIAPPERRLPQR